MLHLLLYLLLTCPRALADWQHVQGQLSPEDIAQGECVVSTRPPTEPIGLEFCHWYQGYSCCVPAADQEAFDLFTALMDLGLACSHSKHSIRTRYKRIREWFCLGCDPQEPQYRFKTSEGSPLNGIPPDTSGTGPHFKWRVCKTFVDGVWHGDGDDPRDGHMYDECGVKTMNPCEGGKQVVYDPKADGGKGGVVETSFPVLNGWDPYQCGDNLIIPSKFYQGESAGVDFLTTLASPLPNFYDIPFAFVVVDNTVSNEECRSCEVNVTTHQCTGCPSACIFYTDPSDNSSRCLGFDGRETPCFYGDVAPADAHRPPCLAILPLLLLLHYLI
eukprot:Sspe_Gene.111191::Locus_92570_Transcript_1_1_Confidence_1.000_Length_1117::g.111191::m.111191